MTNAPTDIKSIFADALEKGTADERRAYLNVACRGNAELRKQVEALLTAHEEADDVPDAPIVGPALTPGDLPLTEGPGTVIDRYKLLEKIGEGGMAVVYMAGQERPIRRKVALKIIKLGMDTRQVIARFEAERQALAMMDHPNIAKVHDAGATETGRPYFVMELVQGSPITEYCDRNRLRTRDRLALFIQACQAVQHAHQKGIIHRDIKPSNVLVTHHDGRPVPKVIDFGIAKATNQKLTEKTLFTRYAHIIGTPAYMSPEQAELSDLDVDTRSDIYSLGVLLYELLIGTPPFSEEELCRAGYVEMQRVIREEEPTKPSTRLRTLGETLPDVANRRSSSPEVLTKTVRGDLDWIVMKSLEKDRARRYETASSLAQDLERHLRHQPIQARPPSTVYRVHKLVRRRQSEALVGLTLVLLIVAVGVILSMWSRDRLRLVEAEALRHQGILSQARELYAKADRQAALETIKPILSSRYVGAEAQLLSAGVLVEERQYDEAIAQLKRLIDKRSEIAGAAHSLWARVLWERESPNGEVLKKLEEHRNAAEVLLPETAEAYFLRAMTALTIKEKREMLDRALALDPGHYESRRLRAFTYYASGKYERLRDDAVVMTVLRPRDPQAHSLYAVALRAMGDYAEAIDRYENAIWLTAVSDAQHMKLNADRCEMFVQMGEYERAVAEARIALAHAPDTVTLHFHCFCALTALGRYEEAESLFHTLNDVNPNGTKFRDWSMKYVFDTLEAGRPWHPLNRQPSGIAFLPMIEAEETYRQLSAQARRLTTDGFSGCWSPDGSMLALSLGVAGFSGVALYDPASQETELLIVPGKDPAWSPDGKYIAFVRDCEVLRVPEFAEAERRAQFRSYRAEEIWLMNPDGTQPRRLARGGWPSWSRDGTRVFYQSRVDNMLYAISVEDPQAHPTAVMPSFCDHARASPDGRAVGYVAGSSFKIVELDSQSSLAEWTPPLGIWGGTWSPDGREFSLGGVNRTEDWSGLWIYDLRKKGATKALSGQITVASWSPDRRQLLFSLGPPYFEIWIADLDPTLPTVDALGSGQTVEGHCREMVRLYSRRIEAQPENAANYLDRATYYEWLGEDGKHAADIATAEALANRQSYAAFHLGVPQNLGPGVNTPAFETSAGISMDGLRFYLVRNRVRLWVSTRVSSSEPWTAALYLGSLMPKEIMKTAASIPFLAGVTPADGLEAYYAADLPNGYGNDDIWFMRRDSTEDAWGPLVNLGSPVNTAYDEHYACISPDGLELYFGGYTGEHTRPGGYGASDLWVSRRATREAPWHEPVNLGPTINSAFIDARPTISPNGLLLFFDSSRPGGFGSLDLYVTKRTSLSHSWEEPINLGPLVNTPDIEECARISADGSMLYWDSPRLGGYGGNDLWQAAIKGFGGALGPAVK